jgi:hypothetical protein
LVFNSSSITASEKTDLIMLPTREYSLENSEIQREKSNPLRSLMYECIDCWNFSAQAVISETMDLSFFLFIAFLTNSRVDSTSSIERATESVLSAE